MSLSPVCPAGVFELTDPSGLPAGHIEVTLKWKSTYLPPSGSIRTAEEPTFILKERGGRSQQELHSVEDEEKYETLQEEEEETSRDPFHLSFSLPEDAASQVSTHINTKQCLNIHRGHHSP